jgi:FAD/FMN-containing dehydrogenase
MSPMNWSCLPGPEHGWSEIEAVLAEQGSAVRLRAARPLAPARQRPRRHARRHDRGQFVRAPAHQGGRARDHCSASPPSPAAAKLQVGQPGDEERHRLRPVEAHGRVMGHARRPGEATFKVLPAPETEATVMVAGLAEDAAARAMSAAMQSAADVSGAAHLPADMAAASVGAGRASETGGDAVAGRRRRTVGGVPRRAARRDPGLVRPARTSRRGGIAGAVGRAARRALSRRRPGAAGVAVSVPPMDGPRVLGRLREACQARGFYDWAGGLSGSTCRPPPTARLRPSAPRLPPATGHATLIRAPAALRASVEVFQPQPPALAALTRRVKEAFDPIGILNPGRMYP